MNKISIDLMYVLVLAFIISLFLNNCFAQENKVSDDLIKLDSSLKSSGYNIDEVYSQPFGYTTFYNFSLPDSSLVNIFVTDLDGDTVKNIFKGILASGYYKLFWNRKNNENLFVASGIYTIKLNCELIEYKKIRNIYFNGGIRIIVIN